MQCYSRRVFVWTFAGFWAVGLCGGCGESNRMPAGQAEMFGSVTKNGKPLVGNATVYHKLVLQPKGGTAASGTPLETQLNEDGSYSITLPQGEYNARVINASSEPVGQQVTVAAKEMMSRADIEVMPK